MLKRNKSKSLYEKALEKKNENIEKEKLYKNLNLDKEKNTIVFEKKNNTFIKFLNFLVDIIEKIIKFLVITVILILLTIGATVLLNPGLRDTVLELIKNMNLLT